MQFAIRYGSIEDIPQINVLRRKVNDIHVDGRPDIFRGGFCDALGVSPPER